MNGNDFLEKLNLIDPELVEAAETARGVGRKAWLIAAAACAVLAFGVIVVLRLLPVSGGEHHALVPSTPSVVSPSPVTDTPTAPLTESPTALTTDAPPITTAEPPRILDGDGRNGLHESVPGPGIMNVSVTLENALKNADNADCLFSVDIELVIPAAEERWRELCREESELAQNPDYKRYCEEYDNWRRERFPFWDSAMLAEYYGYDLEAFIAPTAQGVEFGYAVMCADFEKYLSSAVSEEEFRILKAANDRHLMLVNELYGEKPQVTAIKLKATEGECARLRLLGLNVSLRGDGLLIGGLLPRDRLLDFPASDLYGYYIFWHGAGNAFHD